MPATLPSRAKRYARDCADELISLIGELCAIPSPSNHEEAKAAFCEAWLKKNCPSAAVSTDSASNVILQLGEAQEGQGYNVFMAHMDTVFSDLTPFEMRREPGRLYSPGVGDDSANLAMLLLIARYLSGLSRKSLHPALFVANTGEEGLGNLRGSRQLMADYAGKVRQVISFDGTQKHITQRAVGSARYEITLKAEGGHSYGCFGNTNAIALMSNLICELYSVTLPEKPGQRTTYNVGTITGGTSVNSIAEEAQILYEYRSTDEACLKIMEENLSKAIEKLRPKAVAAEAKLVGLRPCAGEVSRQGQEALCAVASRWLESQAGVKPELAAGSTDCNIPLSLGIPAIAVGLYLGENAHKRDEYVEISSLQGGLAAGLGIALEVLGAI